MSAFRKHKREFYGRGREHVHCQSTFCHTRTRSTSSPGTRHLGTNRVHLAPKLKMLLRLSHSINFSSAPTTPPLPLQSRCRSLSVMRGRGHTRYQVKFTLRGNRGSNLSANHFLYSALDHLRCWLWFTLGLNQEWRYTTRWPVISPVNSASSMNWSMCN